MDWATGPTAAVGSVVSVVFLALVASTGFLAFQVYIRGIYNEEVAIEKKKEEIDIQDEEPASIEQRPKTIMKNAQPDEEAPSKKASPSKKSPAKSPGKRANMAVAHADIEFEIVEE